MEAARILMLTKIVALIRHSNHTDKEVARQIYELMAEHEQVEDSVSSVLQEEPGFAASLAADMKNGTAVFVPPPEPPAE